MTNKNLFPRSFFGRGPSMSVLMACKGSSAGKSFRWFVCFRDVTRLRAQVAQLRTVAATSAALCGQY